MLALTTLKQMADHVESNFQSTIYLTGPICILWRHPRGWGVGLRGAGLSVLSRGFAARPRARCFLSVLCFWVHTQRETWVPVPRPTGSLTARVLGNSGSAPLQVSIRGLVFSYSSSSVVPWDCASSFAPARLSRAPTLWL